jgi:hypothetical protein
MPDQPVLGEGIHGNSHQLLLNLKKLKEHRDGQGVGDVFVPCIVLQSSGNDLLVLALEGDHRRQIRRDVQDGAAKKPPVHPKENQLSIA